MAQSQLKLTPIMGPGCGIKELEHCPEVYHVELTAEQLTEAVQNPYALGLTDIKNVIVEPAENIVAADEPKTMYCCIKCLTHSLCCRAWEV